MPNVQMCIVKGCNRLTQFFKLPTEWAKRLVWLTRSGNAPPVKVKTHWKICPIHFHKKCFSRANLLHRWALPSLFLPAYNPTGGEEDTCFIRSSKAKPPSSPSTPEIGEKRKRFYHDMKFSPVKQVRIPVKTYKSRKTTVESLISEGEEILPVTLTEPQIPYPSTSKKEMQIEIPEVILSCNVKTEIASVVKIERDWEELSETYMGENDCDRSLQFSLIQTSDFRPESPDPQSYHNILNENEDLKVEVQRLNLLVESMKQELLDSIQREINLKQIVEAVKQIVD